MHVKNDVSTILIVGKFNFYYLFFFQSCHPLLYYNTISLKCGNYNFNFNQNVKSFNLIFFKEFKLSINGSCNFTSNACQDYAGLVFY